MSLFLIISNQCVFLFSGTDWLPFAEMPDLRNIALSGNEVDDSRYLELREMDPIPHNAITGNDAVVNFGGAGPSSRRGGGGSGFPGSKSGGGSGFRPVYD